MTTIANLTKKELLIFGWNRKYNGRSISNELMRIIKLFSLDVFQLLIQREEFRKKFKIVSTPRYDSDQPIPRFNDEMKLDPWQMTVDGSYQFTLSTKLGQRDTQLIFSLSLNQSQTQSQSQPQAPDVLGLKVAVAVEGNITRNATHFIYDTCCKEYAKQDSIKHDQGFTRYELEYPVPTTTQKDLFAITATDLEMNKYNKFDMTFCIDILEIKYHKMQIEQELKWKLKRRDLVKLKKKSGKDAAVIFSDDSYDWIVGISKVGGPKSSQRQISIKPRTLPRNVIGVKLEYFLAISGNGKRIENMGTENYNKYGGYLYEWDQLMFKRGKEINIVLNIKIIRISDVDGALKSDLWGKYGFV